MGKLFEPTTEAINNKIAAIAKDKELNNPWIGIHHLHDENRTVFASTNTTVEWSHWDAHEPNNENEEEDCAHLYNERYKFPVCNFQDIGDGYCGDGGNTKECDWDGGDCCGDDVEISYIDTVTNYVVETCSTCACLQPLDFELKSCQYEQISNGICNDESNTAECYWDGGDCCSDNADMGKCLEPSRWNDNNCDEFRRFICEREGTG